MAITARTPTTANSAAGTASTLTPGYPAGSAAGDLIVTLANLQSASSITVGPSGPAVNTKIDTQQGTSNQSRLDAWQGNVTTTDLGTALSVNLSAARNLSCMVGAFAGCTYESITDGTQTAGATTPFPAVTPSKDGSMLVLLVSANGGTGGTAFTLTAPTGWTALGSTETGTGGATVRGAVAMYVKQLGSGTAGTSQGGGTLGTSEGATNRYMTAVMVLAPSTSSTAVAASDSVTASDTLTRVTSQLRSAADAVASSDTLTRVAARVRALSDAVTGSDTISRTARATRTLSDASTVSDSAVAGGSRATTTAASDSVTASDSVSVVFTPAPVNLPPAQVELSSLAPSQQRAIIISPSRTIAVQCELLYPDLSLSRDITSALRQSDATVQWTEDATVQRGCTVTLSLDTELAATDLLRIGVFITADDVPAITAHAYVGVFKPVAPDRTLGTLTVDQNSAGLVDYQVNGQDVTALLDRQIGYSYVASNVDSGGNPVSVLTAAKKLVNDAGLSGLLVDGSAAASTMTQPGVWPLIPSTDDTDTDASASGDSGPTTWRTAINDLLAQINYWGVWADEAGYLRFTPYTDPPSRPPKFLFDADDPTLSSVAPARTRTRDLSSVPNKWVFIWSNMPNDSSGNQVLPTNTNNGVYTLYNQSTGPTSIDARGGYPLGVVPTQISLTAASLADFQSQARTRKASDMRIVTTHKASTVFFPIAGHGDVYVYSDSKQDGTVLVAATGWTMPLNGDDTQWTWQEV